MEPLSETYLKCQRITTPAKQIHHIVDVTMRGAERENFGRQANYKASGPPTRPELR